MNTDAAPTADRIRAWLAEQPCPCEAGQIICASCALVFEINENALDVGCPSECICRGTMVAFEWASKPCPSYRTELGGAPAQHAGSCLCNGSGRILRAVGLEELLERFPDAVMGALNGAYAAMEFGLTDKPDWTGDALRAVAAQVGMPTEKDA